MEALIKNLREEITALRGARDPGCSIDMSRLPHDRRLALYLPHPFNKRCPIFCAVWSQRKTEADA
jgi:hypothetical protein